MYLLLLHDISFILRRLFFTIINSLSPVIDAVCYINAKESNKPYDDNPKQHDEEKVYVAKQVVVEAYH